MRKNVEIRDLPACLSGWLSFSPAISNTDRNRFMVQTTAHWNLKGVVVPFKYTEGNCEGYTDIHWTWKHGRNLVYANFLAVPEKSSEILLRPKWTRNWRESLSTLTNWLTKCSCGIPNSLCSRLINCQQEYEVRFCGFLVEGGKKGTLDLDGGILYYPANSSHIFLLQNQSRNYLMRKILRRDWKSANPSARSGSGFN